NGRRRIGGKRIFFGCEPRPWRIEESRRLDDVSTGTGCARGIVDVAPTPEPQLPGPLRPLAPFVRRILLWQLGQLLDYHVGLHDFHGCPDCRGIERIRDDTLRSKLPEN